MLTYLSHNTELLFNINFHSSLRGRHLKGKGKGETRNTKCEGRARREGGIAVPTGIPSLSIPSLVLLLHFAIFPPLFVVSLGWPLFRLLLPHYVPLGWLLLSFLVFEEFPYFLGYLKHTLCSLNKREDLGENLFNITTIGQIFPK